MNNSDQYHQPILEALSAFVRDGTKAEKGDGPPATEIQAALTVIGRRSTKNELSSWPGLVDLTDAHIPMANLTDAKLSGAILYSADLRAAKLDHTDLSRALLAEADLSGAIAFSTKLSGAMLFSTNLSGAKLIEADLSGAYLSVEGGFNLAKLRGAKLSLADLSGATISQTQLDEACGERVKLPPGLTIKLCPGQAP